MLDVPLSPESTLFDNSVTMAKKKKLRLSAAPVNERTPRKTNLWWLLFSVLLVGSLTTVALICLYPQPSPTYRTRNSAPGGQRNQPALPVNPAQQPSTRFFTSDRLSLVWDKPTSAPPQPIFPTSSSSNIAPADYIGPDGCRECHKQNFEDWSKHPHAWMNAMATEKTVIGDFQNATFAYRGGTGKFSHDGEHYIMQYDRDDLHRKYRITQTIGSRFYQYYIGIGLVGPEAHEHPYFKEEFVLPFGYWIEKKAWVPIVHVHEELPEGQRWEPVEQLRPVKQAAVSGKENVGRSRGVVDHTTELAMVYATSCNYCHTTFPIGELFVRNPELMGASLTEQVFLNLSEYVARSHPEIWDGSKTPESFPSEKLEELTKTFIAFDAPNHATTLGISCEACHLGCRAHSANESIAPHFAPESPLLTSFVPTAERDVGRSAANVNAICARCHTGERPTYAGVTSTWNSTEHSDAMRGSCYSQLSCVHCHEPHKAIGKTWSKTPEQDDASCIACHQQFTDPSTRQLHTHHAPGSSGDHCMNCHMPKINEGMQDVVRTHTIFSPTQATMIEAGEPNACNLCHLDKNIDWTLTYLQTWYGKSYSAAKVDMAYPLREKPVGLGWLQSSHQATRLVTTEAFAVQKAQWGLPNVIGLLDDPYMLNRQFAQTAVESLTGRELKEFNYWFYMTKEERASAIERIQAEFNKPGN